MSLQPRTYEIRGVSPLIMHNVRLADPFDEVCRKMKPLQSKRGKTDEDLLALMALEWEGGLYLNDEGRVVLPADNILRMLCDCAPKLARGLQSKVKAGVFMFDDALLVFPGKTVDKIRDDPAHAYRKMVSINKAKILRCRPIFREWSATIALQRQDEVIDVNRLDELMSASGAMVGLMERRPRFGRFNVEKIK